MKDHKCILGGTRLAICPPGVGPRCLEKQAALTLHDPPASRGQRHPMARVPQSHTATLAGPSTQPATDALHQSSMGRVTLAQSQMMTLTAPSHSSPTTGLPAQQTPEVFIILAWFGL